LLVRFAGLGSAPLGLLAARTLGMESPLKFVDRLTTRLRPALCVVAQRPLLQEVGLVLNGPSPAASSWRRQVDERSVRQLKRERSSSTEQRDRCGVRRAK
jgi:hypothetical protein